MSYPGNRHSPHPSPDVGPALGDAMETLQLAMCLRALHEARTALFAHYRRLPKDLVGPITGAFRALDDAVRIAKGRSYQHPQDRP
ncbi:hypothetical protein ACFU99_20725 [Streptomyces sp. NPDC057654]|uniref:hypothetical protein n=1 Tax=Streptomyces sp. NPDC057654 TaxID=3346196 RepID=UPI0036C12CB3